MYTLQEFIRFTKGWEYVIAIVAVFVFVGFWKLVSGHSSSEKGQGKGERDTGGVA